MDKPAGLFDRDHEWADLIGFVTDPGAGLRLGLVRGRRRRGKSFLLEHLCRETGGVYTVALRQSRRMAIARFVDTVSESIGLAIGTFDDWEPALTAVIGALRRLSDGVPLLVLDEFPYLMEQAPELPSLLQALYDREGPGSGKPPFRLIVCGSSISVMSRLIGGDQALYGRATLDLTIGRFGFRDAADYWQQDAEATLDPRLALSLDAIFGGVAGYRDLVGAAPADESTLGQWLTTNVLNPSHALFREPDYVLAEDPRASDRAIFHAIWDAVSAGASTPTKIGAVVGVDAKKLEYPLSIMLDAGFLRNDADILLNRRPVIVIADPMVRFHHVVVRPALPTLELRQAAQVWAGAQQDFRSKIMGPHFEELCRSWTLLYGSNEAGLDVGRVGATVVSCREHRAHEVDVVGLAPGSPPRSKGGTITVIGEAKATAATRGRGDLDRLRHIRELLVKQGWDAAGARLALFAKEGFAEGARASVSGEPKPLLVDLAQLYGFATLPHRGERRESREV